MTNLKDKRCYLTGGAGFIGSSLSHELIGKTSSLWSIDNLNGYYDPSLKRQRLEKLDIYSKSLGLHEQDYTFEILDLLDYKALEKSITSAKPDVICHLAAQAGVRYSLINPQSYIDNNLTATLNLLEICRHKGVKNFVLASTSSVYGLNSDMPFNEEHSIDSTITTYSATKRACELLCHTYNRLFGIKCRILRFFTVYGPWGRPDMALFLFTKGILEEETIDVFNNGKSVRDFTYIDDIVSGFVSAIEADYDFEIFNLGSGKTTQLMDFIKIIEDSLEIKAKVNFLPPQQGDIDMTFADITKAKKMLGYHPKIMPEQGVPKFVRWYKEHYRSSKFE